jgi:hypothetical protein
MNSREKQLTDELLFVLRKANATTEEVPLLLHEGVY